MTDRCDGCVHWQLGELEPHHEATRAGFRKCNGIQPRWDIEDASIAALKGKGFISPGVVMQRETEAIKAAKAYVQDGSQYVAVLYTGPDFGCVLFKQIGDTQ